jgi:thiamine-monophosphate kinase
MSGHIRLGPGAEFDAVRALLARWGPRARGIGDDAAILDVPAGERLVVSTDATVEEVHFRRPWLKAEEVGWRATTAALSDLAAMGATPLGILVSLTVPQDWRRDLPAIADGIGAACEQGEAWIVGGDLNEGVHLTLAITVLGHAASPLTRAGAQVGDTLYLTGELGGPGVALGAWLRGGIPDSAHRARFAHPEARLEAGRWFASHGAHACIDISDGLAGDIAHLDAASGVCCRLDLGALPRIGGVGSDEALASGEEYELLVAAPSLDTAAVSAASGGRRLAAIGAVEAGPPGGEVVIEAGGRSVARPPTHDHFSRR